MGRTAVKNQQLGRFSAPSSERRARFSAGGRVCCKSSNPTAGRRSVKPTTCRTAPPYGNNLSTNTCRGAQAQQEARMAISYNEPITFGRAGTAKGDRFIITDCHPSFLLRLRPTAGVGGQVVAVRGCCAACRGLNGPPSGSWVGRFAAYTATGRKSSPSFATRG